MQMPAPNSVAARTTLRQLGILSKEATICPNLRRHASRAIPDWNDKTALPALMCPIRGPATGADLKRFTETKIEKRRAKGDDPLLMNATKSGALSLYILEDRQGRSERLMNTLTPGPEERRTASRAWRLVDFLSVFRPVSEDFSQSRRRSHPHTRDCRCRPEMRRLCPHRQPAR